MLGDAGGWDEVRTVVKECAERTCGFIDGRRRRHKWYDDECERAAENRRRKRSRWIDDLENEGKKQDFIRSRRGAKRVFRRKKREEIERKLRDMEQYRRENKAREQFQIIKTIRMENN